MITLTVEAVLGVMLAVVLMQFFKRHPQPPAASYPAEDLANLKPQDARVGDAISISGVLFSMIGGIVGIWLGHRIGQSM